MSSPWIHTSSHYPNVVDILRFIYYITYMKQIKKYPMYYVTSDGHVFSKKSNKYLKLNLHSLGYHQVSLCNEDGCKSHKIHRLVALHFLPNPNGYPCINHLNGVKTDNNISNLEWCTQLHNIQHAIETNLFHQARPPKPVACFTKEMVFVKSYSSTLAAEVDGFGNSHISECCNGKARTHKKLIWKYLPSNS